MNPEKPDQEVTKPRRGTPATPKTDGAAKRTRVTKPETRLVKKDRSGQLWLLLPPGLAGEYDAVVDQLTKLGRATMIADEVLHDQVDKGLGAPGTLGQHVRNRLARELEEGFKVAEKGDAAAPMPKEGA